MGCQLVARPRSRTPCFPQILRTGRWSPHDGPCESHQPSRGVSAVHEAAHPIPSDAPPFERLPLPPKPWTHELLQAGGCQLILMILLQPDDIPKQRSAQECSYRMSSSMCGFKERNGSFFQVILLPPRRFHLLQIIEQVRLHVVGKLWSLSTRFVASSKSFSKSNNRTSPLSWNFSSL